MRGVICSFGHRPDRLRTLVEALVDGTTTIAATDDASDKLLVQTIRVFLEAEPEPTETAALQRLCWFYFAPPHAYVRLHTDTALARLNEAMGKTVGIEIGPRI